MAQHSPAAQKNKGPILAALKPYLGDPGRPARVLEVSSGGGTHVAHFALHLPLATFQPTDLDDGLFGNIAEAVREAAGGGEAPGNVLPPALLDASKPAEAVAAFGREAYDAVVNINMMHIAPYRCAEGLFELSNGVLRRGGRLFTYGPYAENGVVSPDSNVAFDAMLRNQNAEWGLRDIKDLNDEACKNSLCLEAAHDLPANNKLLVWKKL